MNSRLCVRNHRLRQRLRQTPGIKRPLALLLALELPTRLGTAHAFSWLLLLALGLSSARAQEDVAETKATTHIDPTPLTEAPITAGDRSHWAFAPLKPQPLPRTTQTHWQRTAIDAFIVARLEAKGLQPAPEADRPALLRRLSFDLCGLPPMPDELMAFENDKSPDAYERQVDRLLATPMFGERYGQFWLDLARFAETDGYEHDKVRPSAWRYRDWVIGALNADMPYDEFVRQQIAGDASEANATVATTFCLAGPDMPDVNDQLERRHVLMNEMTATVGAVFLGLQLGCAQCHNHKYDPISQADFYRLRAVFEPAVATLKRDVPFNVLVTQKDPSPARFWVRGDHRRPGVEVPPAFPRIASPTLARSASEGRAGSNAADSSHVESGQPSLALRAGTRAELADWLARDDNPLTSRVIANRLWQWHFGRGLCLTPSDFGLMGGQVTHPALLDWLSIDLREHGWATKRLHRVIVSSATYRQISDLRLGIGDSTTAIPLANPKSLDPENTLYSRFPRQRLSGEAIRDAMLAAAGLLTTERGGPGVMPPLPEELLGTLLKGQWNTSKREADHYKRSIYVFARRNLRYPIFEAFDRPDGNASCPVRSRSTTAPQSLLLFNSELSLLAARRLAGRIQTAGETKDQMAGQIERLYLIALSRRPTSVEATTVEQFLTRQRARLAAEGRPRDQLALPAPDAEPSDPFAAAALVDACLAILNGNEFIYVD